MLTTDKLFRHMAWANQQLIVGLMALPDAALGAFVANKDWPVAEILRHIVSAADWYGHRLIGKPETKFSAPRAMQELTEYLELAARFDEELRLAAQAPDAMLEHSNDGRPEVWARSTILSQSIHHATEHRAQLVAALEAKEFNGINLDRMDLWAFSRLTSA